MVSVRGSLNTVSNLSSPIVLKQITEKYGKNYFAFKVGEVNVIEKMKEVDAINEKIYSSIQNFCKNCPMPIGSNKTSEVSDKTLPGEVAGLISPIC